LEILEFLIVEYPFFFGLAIQHRYRFDDELEIIANIAAVVDQMILLDFLKVGVVAEKPLLARVLNRCATRRQGAKNSAE